MLFLSEGVKVVVLFLSEERKEEAKVVDGNFIVVLLLREEPVFSILLLSAGERPPVLSREEVNKREWEVGSLSSWLFLVSFQAMMGGPIVREVSPVKSTGSLGTNLYGKISNNNLVLNLDMKGVQK